MSLPIALAIISTVFFGIAAVYYSLQADKYKKGLENFQNKDALIDLQNLQKRLTRAEVNYSFNLSKILPVVTDYLEKHLSLTTVSTLYYAEEKPVLIIDIKEQIGTNFIRAVKDSTIQSFTELGGNVPEGINENILGFKPNDSLAIPATLFHVPFIVDDKIQAVLTIASSKPEAYSLQHISTLYDLADIVSRTISSMNKKLASEKNRMMDLLGSLTDGFILFDPNLNILAVNNAAKDYLSLPEEYPSINTVFSVFSQKYNFAENIESAIKTIQKIEVHDVVIKEKIFNIIIKPVLDTSTLNLKVTGASYLLHEVTMEKSIAQMKEDFTNIIVHELRSPLTSIKASTQLLTSEAELTEEEKKKLISLIHSQSNKLLDEVSRILDAAKLEAGLFTINKTPADLRKIISEKVALFNAQAQERYIHLDTDIDPTLPVFSFDIIHISEVINNLLSNSLKFTSSGGTIHISAKQEPGKITVMVSDTGCGIPKDKQHLLFSKFSQISTPGAHVGTGLGLYITKGIIKAHGGTIMLNSEVDKGTSITFTLPIELNAKPLEQTSNSQELRNSLVN
jgi:signal transduction histidine kinase